MILAGDIGATNARFGCYEAGERLALLDLSTRSATSADALLQDALAALPRKPIESCCLAVAGPVLSGESDATAQLTNAQLAFSGRQVAAAVGTPRARLVNDMVAIGTAAAELPECRFEALDDVRRATNANGVKAVLAAGSGLGMGIVVDGRCLASEGGHAGFAPVGAFERELAAFTESEIGGEGGGVVTWEHYLSGRGVETLHRAVCGVWGADAPTLAGIDVVTRGLTGDDPICETTVGTWAAMLATAAGCLAVTAVALDGVYLAGSVAVAVAPALRERRFRQRFVEAAGAAGFVADIPLFLMAEAHIGVEGAYLLARGAREGT